MMWFIYWICGGIDATAPWGYIFWFQNFSWKNFKKLSHFIAKKQTILEPILVFF